MGPAEGLVCSARGRGDLCERDPQAVILGQGNRMRANLLAKNGSLATGEGCMLEGSFIARDITIGQKSVVKFDGAFSQER